MLSILSESSQQIYNKLYSIIIPICIETKTQID